MGKTIVDSVKSICLKKPLCQFECVKDSTQTSKFDIENKPLSRQFITVDDDSFRMINYCKSMNFIRGDYKELKY